MEAYALPARLVRDRLRALARGELAALQATTFEGEFGEMVRSVDAVIAAVTRLTVDACTLAEATSQGRLAERADPARHEGQFRAVIEQVNRTLDALVGHLDAVPAPAFIVDPDRNLRWANVAAARLLGRKASELTGAPCGSLFQMDVCANERCVGARAMRERRTVNEETGALPGGMPLDVACSGVSIRSQDGRVHGALEILTDQTLVKGAVRMAEKVTAYQDEQTRRVTEALVRLGNGDLDVQLEIAPADEETEAAGAAFQSIAGAIKRTADAIAALSVDVVTLSDAAVRGELAHRADPARHHGDYRLIVEGLNRAVDTLLAPVGEATTVLERLAAGDLTARTTGTYPGDHARMKEALNRTSEALQEALSRVATTAAGVANAATQIATSSGSVASGATQQAAALEEATATLQSVAEMLSSTSTAAHQADALARSARTSATEGSAAVNDTLSAMARIRTAAEGTSQIIRDINDIAFQTNLLALNAAVEAARAGDAGRGFAVVAQEVRSLALRSKEAAHRTESLIKESVQQAADGEGRSRLLSGRLGEIVEVVGKATDMVARIVASAREQTVAMSQLERAVADIDRGTQLNAASAEQSSAAAIELSSQAAFLTDMVAQFDVGPQPGALARSPEPPAPVRAPLRVVPLTAGAADKRRLPQGGAALGRTAPE